jgi:hypothetical protein
VFDAESWLRVRGINPRANRDLPCAVVLKPARYRASSLALAHLFSSETTCNLEVARPLDNVCQAVRRHQQQAAEMADNHPKRSRNPNQLAKAILQALKFRMTIRIIKHEAVPQTGSFEVRYSDGRLPPPSAHYFRKRAILTSEEALRGA